MISPLKPIGDLSQNESRFRSIPARSGGDDTFLVNPGFGNDTITNFDPSKDVIQFSPALFNNYQAFIGSASQAPGSFDTVITSGGDSVTLAGVSVSDLNQTNVHVGQT